jgi:hypothetical protein
MRGFGGGVALGERQAGIAGFSNGVSDKMILQNGSVLNYFVESLARFEFKTSKAGSDVGG